MKTCVKMILLLASSFFSAGCEHKSKSDELPVIDVAGSLGTYRQVPMSELVSEVEYIPLETGPNCLIDRTNHVIFTADRIFVAGGSYCYAFTREGKFISDVGRKGRGLGEWGALSGISVDEKNKIIYLDAIDKMFEYNWNGRFVREFGKPIIYNEEMNWRNNADEATFLYDNLFLGYLFNLSGIEPHNWVIFDDEGKIIKAFDNHIKLDWKGYFASALAGNVMVSESIHVKEGINDTLFIVNRRHELVPKYVFDLGKYTFPMNAHIPPGGLKEFTSKSVMVDNWNIPVVISDSKILFGLHVGENTGLSRQEGVSRQALSAGGRAITTDDSGTVMGIYDIADRKTDLLDRDPTTRKPGLINDIDGGLSFWPKSGTSTNELVQVLNAYEMKDLLTEEYFATHPIRDPAAHE